MPNLRILPQVVDVFLLSAGQAVIWVASDVVDVEVAEEEVEQILPVLVLDGGKVVGHIDGAIPPVRAVGGQTGVLAINADLFVDVILLRGTVPPVRGASIQYVPVSFPVDLVNGCNAVLPSIGALDTVQWTPHLSKVVTPTRMKPLGIGRHSLI